jgi:hypothetical protein
VHDVDGLLDPPGGASIVKVVQPIPVNVGINIDLDICFLRNGRLEISDNTTVYLSGEIYAGPWRIFDYGGEVTQLFAPGLDVIYPEWWGANANDDMNDSAALRHAGRFLADREGGRIEFSPGTYIYRRRAVPHHGKPVPAAVSTHSGDRGGG